MSVYKDMAHDAGYTGDQAEDVARQLEEQHMRESFYRQLEPEQCPGCGEPTYNNGPCDDCIEVSDE